MITNFYGEELKNRDIVGVPNGIWAIACMLEFKGVPEKEIDKLMKGPEPLETLKKKWRTATGKALTTKDLEEYRDDFKKHYWPKEFYLKNKEKK